MRKRILACLLAVAIVMSLWGCATNQISLKYADEWHETVPVLHTEYEAINKTADSRLNEILAECQVMVRNGIDKERYSFWNWEKLDNVQIFKAEAVRSTYNQQILSGFSDAVYDYAKHEILVFPVCDGYDENYFRTIIIHELIHVLTYTEACHDHMLWEGVADYWARIISEKNELPFVLCYIYEVQFVEMFVTFMGEPKFMAAFYDGSLNEIIDQYTKKGAGDKFESIVFYMANYPGLYGRMATIGEMQTMFKAGQDIICHMCASYIREMEEERQEEISNKMMEKIPLDKEYFKLILDG